MQTGTAHALRHPPLQPRASGAGQGHAVSDLIHRPAGRSNHAPLEWRKLTRGTSKKKRSNTDMTFAWVPSLCLVSVPGPPGGFLTELVGVNLTARGRGRAW